VPEALAEEGYTVRPRRFREGSIDQKESKMKCGNCQADHDTVEEVRACYGLVLRPTAEFVPSKTTPVWSDRTPRGSDAIALMDRSAPPIETRTEPMATDKQVAFLNKLLEERPSYRDVENLWPENVAKLTKRQASRKIEEALKVPKEAQESPKSSLNGVLAEVSDGYLALPSRTGTNDLDFFRISTNQGKVNPANKGCRRVERILGGHGSIPMRISEAMMVAEAIAAMTESERFEAMALFGREIGRCGICGRSLTDEVSRACGIGPVCRGS
jgi:hypothetical protein